MDNSIMKKFEEAADKLRENKQAKEKIKQKLIERRAEALSAKVCESIEKKTEEKCKHLYKKLKDIDGKLRELAKEREQCMIEVEEIKNKAVEEAIASEQGRTLIELKSTQEGTLFLGNDSSNLWYSNNTIVGSITISGSSK
jgi:flagellar biosynthesis chaperone FliJ